MLLSFPTRAHEAAADSVSNFFGQVKHVDTVLVVNSCARGQAVAWSDLDFAILLSPGVTVETVREMEAAWRDLILTDAALAKYRASGPHALLHLDLITGEYQPGQMEEGGMPDYFEVEIGNQVCYSAPMGKAGPYYEDLQQRWLPYYDTALRAERLEMTVAFCEYDLDGIRPYIDRGLHFQAFDRLTVAFQKFLQALFISKEIYPLAYNKWIKMQVVEWLGMPELYAQLPGILSVSNIESYEPAEKAESLRRLLSAL
jgi:predicted nucleotidyltransferase